MTIFAQYPLVPTLSKGSKVRLIGIHDSQRRFTDSPHNPYFGGKHGFTVGVVIEISEADATLIVLWDNGEKNTYKFSDVDIVSEPGYSLVDYDPIKNQVGTGECYFINPVRSTVPPFPVPDKLFSQIKNRFSRWYEVVVKDVHGRYYITFGSGIDNPNRSDENGWRYTSSFRQYIPFFRLKTFQVFQPGMKVRVNSEKFAELTGKIIMAKPNIVVVKFDKNVGGCSLDGQEEAGKCVIVSHESITVL